MNKHSNRLYPSLIKDNCIVIDVETTGAIRNKGHVFDHRNRLVLVGMYFQGTVKQWRFREGYPEANMVREIVSFAQRATFQLIGQNLKFDLNWLRKYGVNLSFTDFSIPPWDTSVAHYLLTGQRENLPSLDDIAARYKLPQKPDNIRAYWERGIDTDQIPEEELAEYNKHDLIITYEIFRKQSDEVKEANLSELMWLCMQDLEVLTEMEYNGCKYDTRRSYDLARAAQESINELKSRLDRCVGLPEGVQINWSSPEQLSAVIYGGRIKYTTTIHDGTFKSGPRAGQQKWKKIQQSFPISGFCRPPKRSKLVKEGQYPTDEETLQTLKGKGTKSKIIDMVLELRKLEKLEGTYYTGTLKKFDDYGWEDDIIHPSLNQVVTVTGRLSCSNPNLQNVAEDVKECIVSRYE